MCHFKGICEVKLDLSTENTEIGAKSYGPRKLDIKWKTQKTGMAPQQSPILNGKH